MRVLTDEIVGLADVVVPHGHLQGLLGEVCIFNVVTELLQNTQQQRTTVAGFLQLAPPRTQPCAPLRAVGSLIPAREQIRFVACSGGSESRSFECD